MNAKFWKTFSLALASLTLVATQASIPSPSVVEAANFDLTTATAVPGPSIAIPAASTRSISASELDRTIKGEVMSVGELVRGQIYEYNYNVGIMGHTISIGVSKIESVQGVYSKILQLPFVTRSVLAGGSVSYFQEEKVEYTVSESASFTVSTNQAYQEGISAALNEGHVTTSMSTKLGLEYAYGNTVTLSRKAELNAGLEFRLDKNTAPFCPANYAISLGLVGQYYVVTAYVTDYTNWWWGPTVTAGTSANTKVQFVLANEADFILCYIYRDGVQSISSGFDSDITDYYYYLG